MDTQLEAALWLSSHSKRTQINHTAGDVRVTIVVNSENWHHYRTYDDRPQIKEYRGE